jgi:molecular chaperone DnaK
MEFPLLSKGASSLSNLQRSNNPMSEMINFGIDLGTTNSLMAKFSKGTVEVFTNPVGFKEILPSAVGFRNDRILVGDKAREYAEKDPKSVAVRFKRRMGTTETFKIQALGMSKTPIELSAFVLKELKTFIHTGETPEAVVITIPASFDMVQANATTQAGHAAGFKQVVLLQEPIAASLAYANKEKTLDLKNSQWVVYDLGGGTFDVALVKIIEGELRIVDHEGDNYLGGADFDALIVERIIAPHLEKKGNFTNLLAQMKSESGKYNRLWLRLLHLAEGAKIELSARTSADIEFAVEDDSNSTVEALIRVTRSEYEAIIKDEVERTAEMLKQILTRNSLRPQDLKFILMVGGSTYTPFVRKRIEELLGIPVNTGINPTNAIAVGAAYFAATKVIKFDEKAGAKSVRPGALRVKASWNRTSQDLEEMFSAKVEGDVKEFYYRVTREDGGYDSGLKQLTSRILEDLPLQMDAYNSFSFRVYDTCNNPVPTDFGSIQIAQGKYSIAGQVLPHDLSLVRDELDTGDTKLDCIFSKNTVLPAKMKRTVGVSKTVSHDSNELVRVIVVEGPSTNLFTANRKQGELIITGKQLKRDLIKGMDIDLTFELSESQDLTVTALINPSGPEFSQVFNREFRKVDVEGLVQEVQMLETRLIKEKSEAVKTENYEAAKEMETLRGTIQNLLGPAMLMEKDDVTDDRFKIDVAKREIAERLSKLTQGKRLDGLRADYKKTKDEVTEIVLESGNDSERQQLHEVVSRESTFLSNPKKLETEIEQLHGISFQVLRRTPKFLKDWFYYLVEKTESFNDQLQAKNLIEAGKNHIGGEAYDKLAEVNARLHSLLPQLQKDSQEMRYFTGIS